MAFRENDAASHHQLTMDGDGRLTVRLTGDIDIANAAQLAMVLRQAIDEGPRVLVVDLEAVTFLDTAGLRLVLQAYHWQREAGYELSVIPGAGIARRVLQVSGLLDMLTPVGERPAAPREER